MNFPTEIVERLSETPLIATVSFDDASIALEAAAALAEGGVTTLEITLRSDASLESLGLIADRMGNDLIVGAGTVLTIGQLRQVRDAGARFAVAPGCSRVVIEEARNCEFPFAPGVATPSEIEEALRLGCEWMKLFPAGALGGVPYLKSIVAPFAHRGVRLIPLGGVKLDSLSEYLAIPEVAAVGGSWLATKEDLANRDWETITKRSRAAVNLAQTTQKSTT